MQIPRRFSVNWWIATITLTIATCAASGLAMLLFAEVTTFISEWRATLYPIGLVCAAAMGLGAFLAWRHRLVGYLIYWIAGGVFAVLLNTVPPENDLRIYRDVITLLNAFALVGIGGSVVAFGFNLSQLRNGDKPPLFEWNREFDPSTWLIAYVVVSLALLFITSTASFGDPFFDLIDRPSHGQDIRVEDILFGSIVLLNQVLLIGVLLGQTWSAFVLMALIFLDIILIILLSGFPLILLGLRFVALGLLYWLLNTNRDYFDRSPNDTISTQST